MWRSRRRRARRSRDDYYWEDYRPRRRRYGLLGCLLRAFLWIVGVPVGVFLLALGATHFAFLLQVLTYALPVVGVIAGLSILYVIVRLMSAISLSLSKARLASAKAKQEQLRARQERVNIQRAQSQLAREEDAFYDAHQPRPADPLRSRESPARTRKLPPRAQVPFADAFSLRGRSTHHLNPYRQQILKGSLACPRPVRSFAMPTTPD